MVCSAHTQPGRGFCKERVWTPRRSVVMVVVGGELDAVPSVWAGGFSILHRLAGAQRVGDPTPTTGCVTGGQLGQSTVCNRKGN